MKKFFKNYLRLIRFIKPYKGEFALAVVFMAFSAVFDGISLSIIVPVTDKVMTNKQIVVPSPLPEFAESLVRAINNISQRDLLHLIIIFMPILFIFKGLVNYYQSFLMSDIGQKVVRDVRLSLYGRMQGLSLDYFSHKRSGELISRITNDVKLVENAVSYGSTDLIYQFFQILLFVALIFAIHWKLALISFFLLPAVSLPIFKVGKVLKRISQRSQEKMADINSLLVETISGVRIVKAFGMEDYEVDKFSRHNRDYYKLTMKTIKRTLLLSPITEIFGVFAGVVVLWIAGGDVLAGNLSFGVFGLFLGSLFSLVRPFKKISQVNAINQQALAAAERIYDVLDSVPTVGERPGAVEIKVLQEEIEYKNVYFDYGAGSVLENINLRVKKGEVIAIVGKSGSGKSTLVDLLPRFYDPVRGMILIDGVNIRDASIKSVRSQMGIVTQETILFNDTVKGNIAYGRKDAGDDDIMEAAKRAHAHEFIQAFPLKYDTFIGDRGVKLSGGERQRLSIARALLKNPPILILDEATSQLDTQSEKIVQDALDRLIVGRTVFIIAHRLSTVRKADRIIVIDSGKVVEEGRHDELLARGGLYKQLYSIQEKN